MTTDREKTLWPANRPRQLSPDSQHRLPRNRLRKPGRRYLLLRHLNHQIGPVPPRRKRPRHAQLFQWSQWFQYIRPARVRPNTHSRAPSPPNPKLQSNKHVQRPPQHQTQTHSRSRKLPRPNLLQKLLSHIRRHLSLVRRLNHGPILSEQRPLWVG